MDIPQPERNFKCRRLQDDLRGKICATIVPRYRWLINRWEEKNKGPMSHKNYCHCPFKIAWLYCHCWTCYKTISKLVVECRFWHNGRPAILQILALVSCEVRHNAAAIIAKPCHSSLLPKLLFLRFCPPNVLAMYTKQAGG
jgi:hypothetical protein